MKKMKVVREAEFRERIKRFTLAELYLVKTWIESKPERHKREKLRHLKDEIERREKRNESI